MKNGLVAGITFGIGIGLGIMAVKEAKATYDRYTRKQNIKSLWSNMKKVLNVDLNEVS